MTINDLAEQLESIVKNVGEKNSLTEPKTWSIVILDSREELQWLAEWAQFDRIKTAEVGMVFCLDYLALRKICPNQEEFPYNDVIGLLSGTASTVRLSEVVATAIMDCGYRGFFVSDLTHKITALRDHLFLPSLVLPVSVFIVGAEQDSLDTQGNGYCFLHQGRYSDHNIDLRLARLWWRKTMNKPQLGRTARHLAVKQLGAALTAFGFKTSQIPVGVHSQLLRFEVNPVQAINRIMRRFPRAFLSRQRLRLILIKHYLLVGTTTAAESLSEKMAVSEPRAPDVLLSASIILWSKGQLQSALGKIATAENLAPDEGLIYCFKGEIYREMGMLRQSQQSLRHSIELNSKDEYAWLALMNTVEEKEGPAAAVAVFENAQTMIVPNTALLNKAGLCYSELGVDDKALHCYTQALSLTPNDPSVLANQGLILGRQGKIEAALACYEQALRVYPNDMYLLNNKGFCLGQLERYAEALRCYERAIIDNENHADISLLHNKATCLSKLGRYKEALSCYDLVLQHNPADTITLNNQGLCLLNLGRIRDALRCYASAIHLEPANGILWGNKGACLLKQGQYEQALEAYVRAVELMPTELAYYSGKGMCLDYLGREDEAVACYNKALRMA